MGCFIDNKCHTRGAIFTNPCSSSQYVTEVEKCGAVNIKYDENLAFRLNKFSAVACAPNATAWLCAMFPREKFRDVKQVILSCEGGYCSGYTAVDPKEKAIIVAFRGTKGKKQLLTQVFKVLVQPKQEFPSGGKVQEYFREAFTLIWDKLKDHVVRYIRAYPKYRVLVTGHSLGGAMASLASSLLGAENLVPKENLLLYTFGQPRVGNYDYAKSHDKLVPGSFRVVHYRDPVPHLPPCKEIIVGTGCISKGGFPYHHGREILYTEREMKKGSSYKLCHGIPHREDLSCMNHPKYWAKCILPSEAEKCVSDHRYYFGIHDGKWWKQFNQNTIKCPR